MNAAEFRIGRVLRQAVAAPWTSIGRWVALAALIQTPILFYTVSGLDRLLPQGSLAAGISTVVHLAFDVIAQAAVTAAMLAHLRGQRVSLGELLGRALRPAPLIRFAIAYGLISGLVAFIQFEFRLWGDVFWFNSWFEFACAGLLYLFLAVTVPVLVNERTGALEALKRSALLTRDHRGRLLGLYAMAYLVRCVTLLPVIHWASTTDSTEALIERFMMWSLASRLIGPVVWGAINTSVYRTLRLVQESVDIQTTPSMPDARIHAPG